MSGWAVASTFLRCSIVPISARVSVTWPTTTQKVSILFVGCCSSRSRSWWVWRHCSACVSFGAFKAILSDVATRKFTAVPLNDEEVMSPLQGTNKCWNANGSDASVNSNCWLERTVDSIPVNDSDNPCPSRRQILYWCIDRMTDMLIMLILTLVNASSQAAIITCT